MMGDRLQTITVDLDRNSKAGSVVVDGEKVRHTTSVALSSSLGVGNHLRCEGFASTRMICAIIGLLESLVEGSTEPEALKQWRGGITFEGCLLADLDSLSLVIGRDDVVRFIVTKRVEELDLTLHSRVETESDA